MIALTDAFALCCWALALSAGALRLQRFWLPESLWANGLLLAFFIVLLVPMFGAGLPLVAFFRGISGDLSITLTALSVCGLSHRLFGVAATVRHEFKALMVTVATAALILYPTALGLGNWDAYRLGWSSWWFLSVLLGLCSVSAWMGLRVLPALVALAMLAWSFGLMESGNLWDYLLDPWLSAFALGYVVNKVFIKCAKTALKRFVNWSSH